MKTCLKCGRVVVIEGIAGSVYFCSCLFAWGHFTIIAESHDVVEMRYRIQSYGKEGWEWGVVPDGCLLIMKEENF